LSLSSVTVELRDDILERMAAADHAYYVLDEPIMEDAEYDDLRLKLREIEEEFPELVTPDSPTQKVSGEASSQFEKVKHLQKMESLDNSFNADDIGRWLSRLLKFKGELSRNLIGELKMDGLSLSIHYEDGRFVRAVTRGDGDDRRGRDGHRPRDQGPAARTLVDP
jgi:DNA ligase (NAD+)